LIFISISKTNDDITCRHVDMNFYKFWKCKSINCSVFANVYVSQVRLLHGYEGEERVRKKKKFNVKYFMKGDCCSRSERKFLFALHISFLYNSVNNCWCNCLKDKDFIWNKLLDSNDWFFNSTRFLMVIFIYSKIYQIVKYSLFYFIEISVSFFCMIFLSISHTLCNTL